MKGKEGVYNFFYIAVRSKFLHEYVVYFLLFMQATLKSFRSTTI